MNSGFQIEVKKTDCELYVNPVGEFNSTAAWELVDSLSRHYEGEGKIVIDTDNLKEVCPLGSLSFRCHLNESALPPSQIEVRGANREEIALEGNSVWRRPVSHHSHSHHCHCKNKCKNCKCAQKSGGRVH